jgi:hypothetical protein
MKTNLLKYYIAAFYFCSTFVLFAQPGDQSDGAPLEGDGDTTPAASIDDYVWVLLAIGLVYVFLRLRAFNLQRK